MNIVKNIKKFACDALIKKSPAIQNLTTLIDVSFDACVKEIYSAKGCIVVTGVGKSAKIANKIVATLNSAGTQAIFIPGEDAIHGDPGMIQSKDTVICISGSGNTPEIKVLIPILKRIGSRLVASVGNTNSNLAEKADFILNATIAKEAYVHRLTPITRTSTQLAFGDVLAVCLLEISDTSNGDFAEHRLEGSLGRQFYLSFSDTCTHKELQKVIEKALLEDLTVEISSKRVGCRRVVTDDHELQGVKSGGDLRRIPKKILTLAKPRLSIFKRAQKDTFASEAWSQLSKGRNCIKFENSFVIR